MPDLNEDILKLKSEGMSLRQIAAALGISHEAVRKRLRAVKDKDQVSTTAENRKLAASNIKKEKVSNGSKPRKSRASEELGDTVNLRQTSTDTGGEWQPFWKPLQRPSTGHERGISGGRFRVLATYLRESRIFWKPMGLKFTENNVNPKATR